MRRGLVYECVDNRKTEIHVDGLVLATPVPGGFAIYSCYGYHDRFLFEEDSQYEEAGGVITFIMPEGNVSFVPLRLEDFNRLEGPSIFSTPPFKNDAEIQAYFKYLIENDS